MIYLGRYMFVKNGWYVRRRGRTGVTNIKNQAGRVDYARRGPLGEGAAARMQAAAGVAVDGGARPGEELLRENIPERRVVEGSAQWSKGQ